MRSLMRILAILGAAAMILPACGGPLASDIKPVSPERSCTKYQSVFDGAYLSNKQHLDNMAAKADGPAYSTFRYALDGMAAMAFGTRDRRYVEQALNWAEMITRNAVISDRDGYLNWRGRWASPYAVEPIAHHLNDVGIGVALSEVARLILLDASWASIYRVRGIALRDFVARHVIEKHLVGRADRSWYEALSLSKTRGLSDRTPQMLRAIVNLSDIGAATELAWAKRIVANWKRYHFEPWGDHATIWDLKRGSEVRGYSWDTSHAFSIPYYFTRAFEAGLESEAILAGLSNLLLRTIWNQSATDPRFTNFVDGINDSALGRGPWGLGIVYHGWVTLGAHNRDVQAVMEDVLIALTHHRRNPSLDSMNTVWGRIELAGHITRNLRLLGKCQ
jgi:hypothetical protein